MNKENKEELKTVAMVFGTLVVLFALPFLNLFTVNKKSTVPEAGQIPFPVPTLDELNKRSAIVSNQKQTVSTWSMISPTDQSRMSQIILGVMQNTIAVTPEIKQEFLSIFKKYNATDQEIEDFGVYGPAIAVYYQKLFFTDALQAIQRGIPVKSQERIDFETESLKRRLLTEERIQQNWTELYAIAHHQPIDSSGRILTINDIKQVLNNIDVVGARLSALFRR